MSTVPFPSRSATRDSSGNVVSLELINQCWGGSNLNLAEEMVKPRVSAFGPQRYDEEDKYPIHWAAAYGTAEACKVLLDNGATIKQAVHSPFFFDWIRRVENGGYL